MPFLFIYTLLFLCFCLFSFFHSFSFSLSFSLSLTDCLLFVLHTLKYLIYDNNVIKDVASLYMSAYKNIYFLLRIAYKFYNVACKPIII